ncbi:unnamed protein product, partial [Polarella glacialis]
MLLGLGASFGSSSAEAPDKLKAIENIGLQSVIDRIFALLQDGSVDKQPVSLANIFWACAKMGYVDLPLYDVIVEETMRHLVELDCQECSNMCWAFASLELFHGPLLTQLRIRAMDLIPRFDLQDLSNTSWALAKLGVLDEPLMSAVADASCGRLQEGIPQNLSNLAWSFATLAVRPLPLLDELATASRARCAEFEMQDLTNIAWSFATLEIVHGPLMDVVAEQALDRSRRVLARPDRCRATLQELAFALVSLSWAFAFTSSLAEDLASELKSALLQIGGEIDARYASSDVVSSRAGAAFHREASPPLESSASPELVIAQPGIAVILKPPGWEVDGPQSQPGGNKKPL